MDGALVERLYVHLDLINTKGLTKDMSHHGNRAEALATGKGY